MEITDKINLEGKFNKLQGVTANYLLRFNDQGELKVVDPASQGILPQIKVIANSGYIVNCKRHSGGTNITASANYPSNTWYFNVPGLSTQANPYDIEVKASSTATSSTYSVDVQEYKQYIVNAMT